MKKFLVISMAAFVMAFASSCSVNRAMVKSTEVNHPSVETATMASLDISKKRITYTYTPTTTDSKNLSESKLIQNAVFKALEANGNADVLVQVNSMVHMRKGLFGSRVKSITVSGYPAYYVDFREPSDMDLKSVYIFQGNHGKKKADGEDGILNKLFNR